MEKIELKKLSEYEWEIPKSGNMKVPSVIFASEKLIKKVEEDRTLEQLKNMACLPGIYKRAIAMPDAHQGYGFCIGGVAALDFEKGGISPGGVGYDINCGVRLMTTPLSEKELRLRLNELMKSIFTNVPSGLGSHGKIKLSPSELKEVMETGINWCIKKGYATEDDKNKTEEYGNLLPADASFVSDLAKKRGAPELGSLGSGNHFLEIQRVDRIFDKETAEKWNLKEGMIIVMIHSGSRGLGHQVCSDYLRRIEKENPDLVSKLPDRELVYAPAGTKTADEYFKAMACSANYAWCNRQLMMHWIRECFYKIFGKIEMPMIYDVCHNICKIEEYDGKKFFVHRKGATRAFGRGNPNLPKIYQETGQPVILPGSMGTASYILVGTKTAEEKTFGSTAHGAGRVMSREKAKRTYRAEQIKKELFETKNIIVMSSSFGGITEEAPGVYKDIDEVAEVSDKIGIAKKVVRMVPIGVIKG